MNALDRRPGVLPLDGHARGGRAAAGAPRRRDRGAPGRRVRPGRSSRPPASARATPASCRSSTASLYVMTPEFGAASQLEKIDMLDFADAVAINKFERRGAEDARRDVGRQLVRNRDAFGAAWEDMPVFGTSAATFNDDGVTALYQHLRELLRRATGSPVGEGRLPGPTAKTSTRRTPRHPAEAGALPRRHRRDRPRLPRRDRSGGPSARGAASTCGRPGELVGRARVAGGAGRRPKRRAAGATPRRCSTRGPPRGRGLLRRRDGGARSATASCARR